TETLTPEDFPAHIQHKANGPSAPHTESFALGEQTLPQYLHDLEKALILKAYQQCNHVKTKTARLLGIKPSTLYYKLANYGIENKVSE
ncbi:MAG: helix-turn-helix domain-containing protein, partial [Myxococcota bacterium]